MRKRRFSITQQEAESLCVALTVAETAIAEEEEKNSIHSAYFDMRRKEWDTINTKFSNYKWEVE